jgi:hypothetical protein
VFGCVTRNITVSNYFGGGYVSDPETSTPALDVSTTQSFDICAYNGTVSWGTLGIWAWDAGDEEWIWAGEETEQEEPDASIQVVDANWTWNIGDQEFVYTGDETDWDWDGATREWTYTGSDDPIPSEPAKPPPQPDTTPPSGGYTTLVVHALVDMMPVPNQPNDLQLDLGDGGSQLYGTLVIPAVSNAFGGHWRWVAVTQVWQYVGSNTSWRWHSQLGQWQYLANPDWSWNTSTETFTWQGEGTAPSQPSGPPTQGGSTFPPDGAKWTLVSGVWTAPSSGAYALSGGAPEAGPYEGFKTLHLLN